MSQELFPFCLRKSLSVRCLHTSACSIVEHAFNEECNTSAFWQRPTAQDSASALLELCDLETDVDGEFARVDPGLMDSLTILRLGS